MLERDNAIDILNAFIATYQTDHREIKEALEQIKKNQENILEIASSSNSVNVENSTEIVLIKKDIAEILKLFRKIFPAVIKQKKNYELQAE
jgi:hypothetical protein